MTNFILAAQTNPALVPTVMLLGLFVLSFGFVVVMAIFEAYRNQPKYRRPYIYSNTRPYGR
jgi:hypothetical protein